MRTTVTIDSDVAAKIENVMRTKGLSFKEALNQALRAGLGCAASSRKNFSMKTKAMGFDPTINFDRALALADKLEDDEHMRQLQLGK